MAPLNYVDFHGVSLNYTFSRIGPRKNAPRQTCQGTAISRVQPKFQKLAVEAQTEHHQLSQNTMYCKLHDQPIDLNPGITLDRKTCETNVRKI